MSQFFLTVLLAGLFAFQQSSGLANDLTSQFNRAVALQQQGKLDEAAAQY